MKHTKRLESTAYHEAGHAVMAVHEGVALLNVSIVSDGDSQGRAGFSNPLSTFQLDVEITTKSRWRMEKLVRVWLAGPEAQKRFNPRSWRRYHGEDDFKKAVDRIGYFATSNDEIEAYLRLLEIQVRQKLALSRVWQAVEALAGELLEHRELGGGEARAIIKAAMAPPKRYAG